MTPKVLSEILSRYGAGVREGDAIHFDKDTQVTVFASLGHDALTIDRVVELVSESELVVVTTARKERYVLFYEDIRGVRLIPAGETKKATFL
ncbi:hypothetical protein [Haliangium sp.]|uniref:hypothetical protein n=1 Tax=Haliangium sp. TaxID=2663208 RepID=UPI003D149703